MKKFFLLLVFFLCSPFALLFAQTTAMDWTKNDCNSNTPHHLYAELDSGFVIVQEYVMMNCTPCITGGNGLKNLVAPFNTSHPGKVRIYQTVYENTTTCNTMNTWAANNNFTASTLFRQGSAEVNYYGGMGMPTIVVMGGADHSVFYVHQGYSPSQDNAIMAAINSAIAASTVSAIDIVEATSYLSILPNPAYTTVSIYCTKPLSEAGLFDLSGKLITYQSNIAGNKVDFSVQDLPNGIYMIKATDKDGQTNFQKLVKQ